MWVLKLNKGQAGACECASAMWFCVSTFEAVRIKIVHKSTDSTRTYPQGKCCTPPSPYSVLLSPKLNMVPIFSKDSIPPNSRELGFSIFLEHQCLRGLGRI